MEEQLHQTSPALRTPPIQQNAGSGAPTVSVDPGIVEPGPVVRPDTGDRDDIHVPANTPLPSSSALAPPHIFPRVCVFVFIHRLVC